MSEIVKAEYNALGEDNNYKTYYFKTSADLVEGLSTVGSTGSYNDLKNKPVLVNSVNGQTGDVVVDLPVGHMYWSVEPNVPAGRLPAMGATYNRALYFDLWNWAQERGLVISESEWQAQASANGGNCAFYSDGDGSTTFRVPSIKCWVKGADGEEIGSYLEAGLPNVTGEFQLAGSNTTANRLSVRDCTGAFSSVEIGELSGYSTDTPKFTRTKAVFNASNSNAIYGNSDTVQPPSLVGQWLIVAFGVAHNIGNADVANVMQAVESVQTAIAPFGSLKVEADGTLTWDGKSLINNGTVTQKASGTVTCKETTNVTYTISNLTALKPLHIGMVNTGANRIFVSVTSGTSANAKNTNDNKASTIGHYSLTGYGRDRWSTIVPTGTSVVLTFYAYAGDSTMTIIAYQ